MIIRHGSGSAENGAAFHIPTKVRTKATKLKEKSDVQCQNQDKQTPVTPWSFCHLAQRKTVKREKNMNKHEKSKKKSLDKTKKYNVHIYYNS